MYDFYFGTGDAIDKDPKTWLLAIKRMMPRWPNGIPDSEYLALARRIYDVLLPPLQRFVRALQVDCGQYLHHRWFRRRFAGPVGPTWFP